MFQQIANKHTIKWVEQVLQQFNNYEISES